MRARLGAMLIATGAALALGSTALAQGAPSILILDQQPVAAGATITIEGSAWTCVADITVTLDGAFLDTIIAADIVNDGFSSDVQLPLTITPGAHIIAASASVGGGSSGGGCQAAASTTVTVIAPDTTTSTTVATTVATSAPSTTSAPTTVEQEGATTTAATIAPSTSQALATRLPATGGETELVPYALVTMAAGVLLVLVTRRRPA
jgi:hypothetical protein